MACRGVLYFSASWLLTETFSTDDKAPVKTISALGLIILPLLFFRPSPAEEKSLGIGYGPTDNLNFTWNRNAWGLYASPFWSYKKNDYSSQENYSLRCGPLYSYTAFAYRQAEVRAQFGLGLGTAVMRINDQVYYSPAPPQFSLTHTQTQAGLELWIQPEFRFYQRFSLLLEANIFRYVWEESFSGAETTEYNFITQDFSVSGLKVGLRYYFQFLRKE